jgi:RNA polymerase sigma-70 factor (ECF subfamily)
MNNDSVKTKKDDKYAVPFLKHLHGYEYKEIGLLLNLPIGTVKSRLYTARQTLQKMIKSRDGVSIVDN